MDDVGGSDVSSEAVRGAFAPDASSAETRPGGESGSGGSARGHSETYSDDFGSGDDGISEDGACLNDPVDDAPESPAGKAPSHPGAFATTGDPSAPEEKRQGVHSATRNAPPRASSFAAAPARTAAGLGLATRGHRPRARRPIPGARAPRAPGCSAGKGVRPRTAATPPPRREKQPENPSRLEEERIPRGRPSRGGSPRWSRARAPSRRAARRSRRCLPRHARRGASKTTPRRSPSAR